MEDRRTRITSGPYAQQTAYLFLGQPGGDGPLPSPTDMLMEDESREFHFPEVVIVAYDARQLPGHLASWALVLEQLERLRRQASQRPIPELLQECAALQHTIQPVASIVVAQDLSPLTGLPPELSGRTTTALFEMAPIKFSLKSSLVFPVLEWATGSSDDERSIGELSDDELSGDEMCGGPPPAIQLKYSIRRDGVFTGRQKAAVRFLKRFLAMPGLDGGFVDGAQALGAAFREALLYEAKQTGAEVSRQGTTNVFKTLCWPGFFAFSQRGPVGGAQGKLQRFSPVARREVERRRRS